MVSDVRLREPAEGLTHLPKERRSSLSSWSEVPWTSAPKVAPAKGPAMKTFRDHFPRAFLDFLNLLTLAFKVLALDVHFLPFLPERLAFPAVSSIPKFTADSLAGPPANRPKN
eukprot:6583215-Pyramimonas_sp.AAC.1